MVVDQRTADDRRTHADGDAFPAVLLFGTRPDRGAYHAQTQDSGKRNYQRFRRFHFQPPL